MVKFTGRGAIYGAGLGWRLYHAPRDLENEVTSGWHPEEAVRAQATPGREAMAYEGGRLGDIARALGNVGRNLARPVAPSLHQGFWSALSIRQRQR